MQGGEADLWEVLGYAESRDGIAIVRGIPFAGGIFRVREFARFAENFGEAVGEPIVATARCSVLAACGGTSLARVALQAKNRLRRQVQSVLGGSSAPLA